MLQIQIRAVHNCPLEKIVLIGQSSPLGNSWGLHGQDMPNAAIDGSELPQIHAILEEESKDAIVESANESLPAPPNSFKFEAVYGWPPGPPLLHTIAVHHWSTITELKLCGYIGSPILHMPPTITPYMLHHLSHFPNLRTLIMSFWLTTYFDFATREGEIIRYWLDQRESSSTALVILDSGPVQPTGAIPTIPYQTEVTDSHMREFNPWQEALERLYSPSALADAVFKLISPHLAPTARAAGVDVRASFCIGVETGDIFDLDVAIDDAQQPKSWNGPREEGEGERWWGKLEARQWF
jgi:hypothetical protein